MRATTIFPLANLHNLRTELDGMFRPFPLRSGFPARWSPRVDTHETEDAFLVAVDLPGVASEDVSVNLEKGVLTVSGERKSSFGLNGDAEQRSHGKVRARVSGAGRGGYRIDRRHVQGRRHDPHAAEVEGVAAQADSDQRWLRSGQTRAGAPASSRKRARLVSTRRRALPVSKERNTWARSLESTWARPTPA